MRPAIGAAPDAPAPPVPVPMQPPALLTPRLAAAYRRSGYEAAGAIARIGRRSAALDLLLSDLAPHRGGRHAAFVGAWNPRSRRHPEGSNARALDRLRAAARRLPQREGWGGDAAWRERHLLILGDPRRLLVLARRFRQHAIVLVRPGAPARLLGVDRPA